MFHAVRSSAPLVLCLLLTARASLAGPSRGGDTSPSVGGVPATVFGPQGFQRTNGKPDVFQQTFAAAEQTGQLELFNGGPDKGTRVTSAWVTLNGVQIFGPDDFKKAGPFLQAPVTLTAQNTLRITLASNAGSYLVVRVTEMSRFEEHAEGASRADLAVTSLVPTPDRCSPGTEVSLQATVKNFGPEESGPATLALGIDDATIADVPVDALAAQASATYTIPWAAALPGRHQAWASVRRRPRSWAVASCSPRSRRTR